MISLSKSKLIRSLNRKKYRDQHKLYVAEGGKMVRELLDGMVEGIPAVQEIFATARWIEEHGSVIPGQGIVITESTEQELGKVSNLVTPQQVLALVRIPDTAIQPESLLSETVLGLESIRDPGNLGTIIRTADWFGIRHIVCTPDSVDLYNPKVVQSTMGAMVRVKVCYWEIEALLKEDYLQDKPVYGTFLSGQNIYETHLQKDPLILFGNESRGLSSRYDPFLTSRISIPSFSGEHPGSESLNLASSVAVVCSEIRRRA
jgi:TrmH family RNA methyltransferase